MALLGNLSLLLAGLLLIVVPYVRGQGQCEAYHLKENSEKTLELTETEAWTDFRCDLFAKSSKDDVFTLTGLQPSNWPKDAFCLAAYYPDLGDSYEFDVDLWSQIGNKGINDGYLGIAFNVKDERNYDYVFFRLGKSENNYQAGYVEKGISRFVKTGSCPHGPPQGRTWFNVKLDMTEENAIVTLDGRVVVTFTAHFDAAGNVGVLLANGFDNTIRFKNPSLTGSMIVMKPMPVIGPKSCKISGSKGFKVIDGELKNISRTEFVLSSTSSYARALTKQFYRAFNSYWISVDIYFTANVWAGVVFNAKDSKNFEEFKFWCGVNKIGYHYLYANGALTSRRQSINHASIIIPVCNTWYNVKINIKGDEITTYINDDRIGKMDTFKSLGGHVGMFAYESGTEVIFKNFEVHVPTY